MVFTPFHLGLLNISYFEAENERSYFLPRILHLSLYWRLTLESDSFDTKDSAYLALTESAAIIRLTLTLFKHAELKAKLEEVTFTLLTRRFLSHRFACWRARLYIASSRWTNGNRKKSNAGLQNWRLSHLPQWENGLPIPSLPLSGRKR
jgi:hypothetical protein